MNEKNELNKFFHFNFGAKAERVCSALSRGSSLSFRASVHIYSGIDEYSKMIQCYFQFCNYLRYNP
jgi:hypothetical protein